MRWGPTSRSLPDFVQLTNAMLNGVTMPVDPRTMSDRYAVILRQLLGVTDAELRGKPTEATPAVVDGYDDC